MRICAVLSAAYGQQIAPPVIKYVERAARRWREGDPVLAHIELAFARLPRLETEDEALRLFLADALLADGLSPSELAEGLGLDLGFWKYDPSQPRVPAGQGRASGQWNNGTDPEMPPDALKPSTHAPEAHRLPIVPIAADGPLKPAGLNIVPLSDIDPLDPKGLNTPLEPAEQQAIADIVNTILGAKPEDILTLKPHPYENRPDKITGAQLPTGVGSYVTHYIRQPGSPPGLLRLMVGANGKIYYTNNHYKIFYSVNIRVNPNGK